MKIGISFSCSDTHIKPILTLGPNLVLILVTHISDLSNYVCVHKNVLFKQTSWGNLCSIKNAMVWGLSGCSSLCQNRKL